MARRKNPDMMVKTSVDLFKLIDEKYGTRGDFIRKVEAKTPMVSRNSVYLAAAGYTIGFSRAKVIARTLRRPVRDMFVHMNGDPIERRVR